MANASPAAKPADQEQDLSMEEILQSIRRIIAEEGEDDKAKPAAQANTPPQTPGEVPGSDVLELTDMVQEDGSIRNVADTPPAGDVLEHIDQALATEEPSPMVDAAPPAVEERNQAVTESIPSPPAPPIPEAGESLLSAEAAAASAAALKKIAVPATREHPAPTPIPFRSGYTVEDLVLEALKPMLKEWLDANLPHMVERIVEREIRKLTE